MLVCGCFFVNQTVEFYGKTYKNIGVGYAVAQVGRGGG